MKGLCCGIIAGGKSSRMKKEKLFLTLEGKTFIERIAGELKDFSDEVYISLGKNAGISSYEKLNLPLIFDEEENLGPMEGLSRLLSNMKADYCFVTACDMPFLTKKVPEFLSSFISSDYDIYVLTEKGRPQPLCAIYSKKILPEIQKLKEQKKLKLSCLFESCPTKFIPIEISSLPAKSLVNINTPEEYKKILFPLVFCICGFKNSGKTRLSLLLQEELQKEGYSTAFIKHDGHDCFSEEKNTDTARLMERGAENTILFSDSRLVFRSNNHYELEEAVEKMKEIKNPPQIIIIEGGKYSEYPKIEVLRKNVSEKAVCPQEHLICRVWENVKIPELLLCLKKYFNLE